MPQEFHFGALVLIFVTNYMINIDSINGIYQLWDIKKYLKWEQKFEGVCTSEG